jgi:hypothetical protein
MQMTNKYDNLRLNVILDRIKDKNILTKTADVICRMRENVDCPNFFYIPIDCMNDMDYVIAAINYIIVSFGYKAHWDCLSYAKVGGKYCIHLFLEEIDL